MAVKATAPAKKMVSIVQMPIGKLTMYARNPRHNDGNVDAIAASIKEFGWTQPIVADAEGVVIAGHTRLKAAKQLGFKKVPVYTAKDWTEAQVKAYRLADNKLAEGSAWDNELLGIELGELVDMGLDATLLGFSEDEIDALLADKTEGLTDPDAAPDPPADPVTKPGDVWIMGNHRLVCGDATVATDVEKCLDGVKPLLMVTDPPYGVNYDAEWRLKAGVNKEHQTRAEGKVPNDDRADWNEAWALFPGDVIYCWHGALHATLVADSLAKCDFGIRSQIIWSKPSMVIGRGDYHWQHEPCWYAVKKNRKGHYDGGRKQTTIWDIPNMHRTQGDVDDGKTNHSTQKPVECMRRPIVNNSSAGQAVYDPFCGSGTTIIAAEMEGRSCHAIELDPAYCDVIVARWQDFTGEDAVNATAKARKITYTRPASDNKKAK